MSPPQITFRSVNKSFGTERVLDQFELSIESGDLFGIVGPSGCGKSTLLRIIAGLESVDSGELRIERPAVADDPAGSNRPLNGGGPQGRTDIGFVFQEPNLLPWLTAFDNVALPYRISGIPVDQHQVGRMLKLVNLPADAFRKYPKQLSGGMKMRVSIARALVLDPSILLLDEPFAALDDILRTALNLELIELWRHRPLTSLFVTHNISEAIFVSRKIVVLHRGQPRPVVVEVPFDYPRDRRIRTTTEFARLFARISSLLEPDIAAEERVTAPKAEGER